MANRELEYNYEHDRIFSELVDEIFNYMNQEILLQAEGFIDFSKPQLDEEEFKNFENAFYRIVTNDMKFTKIFINAWEEKSDDIDDYDTKRDCLDFLLDNRRNWFLEYSNYAEYFDNVIAPNYEQEERDE